MRKITLIAALAAGSSVLLAGQAPQEPPPTFRQGVDAVQLSVIVTDSEGNPVSGLTADDFEILENKVSRPITTFAAVDIPIERLERTLVEKDVRSNDSPPGRLYVIALDQMAPESALRARAFLRRFIEQYFGPNDTAAVVLTTGGPRESGQEFTGNPRLLLAAIDKFDGGTPDMGARFREKNFIGDFKNLMEFMSTLRGGRKAVIFVSQNIPVDAYDVVDKGRKGFGGLFSSADVDREWVDGLSFATRNNIAIYPVDPRGLTTGVTGESEDGSIRASESTLDERIGLGGLATVTGGFALTNSNNYAGAFQRLVRENSTYYLLAFNSGIEQRDGRYVPIEVRVKRPGLQVRSTDGYVMPRGRPQQLRRPPASAVLAATWDAVASAITTSGVSMRVYAVPFRAPGKTKEAIVAITVELSPERLNLLEQNGAYRGQLEIVFAVTDAKKRRFPIWRHRAELALKPETYERVSKGAMRIISQMPLPEGHFQIRASAGSAAVAGSVIYDLDVPDFRDDFALSGVALTSKQASETFTFSPHRINVGLPGPPTTAREFSRDDTLTLFAEAYENRKKPHTITLTVELRDEKGRSLGSYVMERKAVAKPKEASTYTFSPNLPLEDVSPGRYALHIDARSSLDKNKPVTRDIPFSVR